MEYKLALLTALLIGGHEEHPYGVLTWWRKLKTEVFGYLP
jgi:hypothetical protein